MRKRVLIERIEHIIVVTAHVAISGKVQRYRLALGPES